VVRLSVMSPLSNLPGPWRWEQRGDKWWRIHDGLNIEDGPHDVPHWFCDHDDYVEMIGKMFARRCRRCPAVTVSVEYPPEPLPPWMVLEEQRA
jgi:hypothetical protein